MMYKKSHLFALLAILAFVGLMIADTNADYVCGDANSDGTLNVSDAVFILNYVFVGGPAPDSNCCEPDCPPTVTDIDGNEYQTILIGDQCWMMENLKVTHYRNGDPIPHVTDGGEWSGLSTGAYCEYDNDPANVETYGRLYNWYAVDDSRNIAPEGWHVPSDAELKQLEMYLGMSQSEADDVGWRGTDEGCKLREAGTTHWESPNTGATNESGFTALPGGYRHNDGYFYAMGYGASFWPSTEIDSGDAYNRSLGHNVPQVYRGYRSKRYGYSVRCVRD
jgi:uncharacterized protein (TIGR02145 family)